MVYELLKHARSTVHSVWYAVMTSDTPNGRCTHMTLGRPAVISGQSMDNVGSWFPSTCMGLKLSFQYNVVLAIMRNGRWCQITTL